jgi:carboxyl-terminal processing protease
MFQRKKYAVLKLASAVTLIGGLTAVVGGTSLYFRGLHAAKTPTHKLKSMDEYWDATGLESGVVEALLTPQTCEASSRQFLACANAITSIAQKYRFTVVVQPSQTPAPAQAPALTAVRDSADAVSGDQSRAGRPLLSGEIVEGLAPDRREVYAERDLLAPWQQLLTKSMAIPRFPFLQIWRKLFREAVPEAQKASAVGLAMNSFLSVSQDPHTYILPADYYGEVVSKSTHPSLSIGLVLGKNERTYFVKKLLEDSSADLAGLKKGDSLVELNGKKTRLMSPFEISDELKGDVGSTLKMKVARGKDILELTVVRSERSLRTVSSRVLEGIKPFGVLTINKFASGTCGDVRAALDSLKLQGITGLLIDLRDNPGGQMSEAACVTSLFLGPGKKVFDIKMLGETTADESVYTSEDKVYAGPIAVLVNSGSASAAEILAGALQDQDRAVLVGERTFGKGSFQEGEPWPGNDKLVLFRTKGFYFLPSGFTPQLVGLEPDVKLDFKDKFALRESELYGFPLSPTGVDVAAELANSDRGGAGVNPLLSSNIVSCVSFESALIAPDDPEIQEAHRILNCRGIAARGER